MNTPELELEQKLENIFSAGLEMLRGGWDVQQATQILLALFFNKRLLALIAERKIDFLTLSAPNALLWENLKHESMPDPAHTLCLFEEVLLELIQQNRALSHIFRPLLEALKTQALSDYLWQTIQHLQEADFSCKQFSVEIFGRFFTQSLYRSALKSGKTGADISTPVFINKLLVALSQPKRGELIYDPCVGQGNTFIEFYRSSSRLQFIGQELDFNVWAIAQMNLWANGVYDADILCQNSLFETPYDFPPADIAVGHFPFGLFVDTQTVKEQPYIAIPFAVSNTPSLDGNGLFIQRMLYQLHEKGKACIVLPLQVTYKDRLDRRLREFLLRRDWIDTIIALPAGLLPTTGTPVSVWVIQKSKPAHRKDKVLFINASNIESQARTRLSKSLADAQIGEIFQAYKLGEAKANSFLSDNVAFVPTIYVMDNEYNLNPKQYASRFIQKLNQLRTTQQLIPLNQLFGKEQAFVWFDTQNPPPRPLPFVQPSNLGNSFAEYPLAPNVLQTSEQVGIFEGRLLNSSALLVYTKSNKLKVSYYEHNQDAVLVSKDILVLFIEDPHLNIEYLLLQLHADLFAEQMLLYKSDHLDTELSEREFVHLQIILPERLIQDRIVRETKTQLLRAEENKVEALRQTLNLGKQKSQNEQYKIISSLQHELGNRLPAVLTEFKNLKDFIHDKIDAQTPLDWKEPIFPLFEDENPDTVDTLADTVRRIEQLLTNTLNTLDATSSIISADKTRLQLQPVSVKSFLENIANLYKNEPHFSIQIEIETDESGKEIDFVAKMDVTQMETLFVNFIENAKRHGFVNDKKYLVRFRVGLSEDEKELIIEYENDGRPFPSNFSFEDFISFGNYAGETGHSGIGGYLINQIIENHEGTLSYRTQIDRNDPFKVQFEICLPYVRR